MKKEFFHQGDVQIRSVKLPKGLKEIEKKPVALGELSGHQHVITGKDYRLFEDDNGTMFVTTGSDGAMMQHIHESNFTSYETTEAMPIADHNIVKLSPNTTYKLGIHKKFDPFEKTFKKVVD